MLKNVKLIISSILILAGLALAAYGAGLRRVSVLPAEGEEAIVLAEPAVVKEVSISGLKLEDAGKIRQTYTGKPPEACHT